MWKLCVMKALNEAGKSANGFPMHAVCIACRNSDVVISPS